MRNLCLNVLSAADHLSTNGAQIDANQLVSASFHAYFSDTNTGGTFKLQASNDPSNAGNLHDFTVTNWVDIPSQSATITSGASALLTIANMTYRWIRAVYVDTAAGIQHITTVADVAGSLNSKYFLLSAGNNGINYYVWINVDSTGVDPAIPLKTGLEVDISSGDTAATIATATAAAIAAAHATADFTAAAVGAVITVTNKQVGPFIAASDFNTTFTFAITGGGNGTVNVNMNALGI